MTKSIAFSRRRPAADARQSALLLERRAHRRRRPARPLGVALDLLLDLLLGRRRAARAARSRRAPARSPPLRAPTSRWLSRNASQSMPAWRGSMFCSISRRANSSSRRSISRSTSDAGTSNGTRAASCFISSARTSRSAACRASCSRSSRTRARSASSVSNSPRSFANSSSSSGSTRRLIALTVTVYTTRRCPPAPRSGSRPG